MTLEEMKRLKAQRGYTMAQLSEYSGVPLGTLQKIFNGETANPRYETRRAIERTLEEGYNDRVCESAVLYGFPREKKQGEYTVEDYYALPDDRRVELIDGVFYDMSAPGSVHQRIAGKFFARVDAFLERKGGSCIPFISPVDVRLDCDERTNVQPDFLILCDREKLRRWGIMGAPEFVLEVISKSTRRKDYTKKVQKYADAGVKEYWIIDPQKKMLVTYDFAGGDIPCIRLLEGSQGLALYGGELQIDLGEIAALIEDLPE